MTIEVSSVIEKVWKPNPGKQALFMGLPDTIFERFFGGSAGPGKSEALLMFPLMRQFTDVPRFQALLLRRTYKELEDSLIARSKQGGKNKDGTEIPSFYDFGAVYNEQKKKWRFPSGATIIFGHAEEEEDVRKYDTAEFQYIGFDELTSFTEFQYKFLAFSRCRSIIPGIPAIVASASNPGNIGHRWVRERFVEPAPEGGKIIVERIQTSAGVREVKRIFIQAFLRDNPKLMENDPNYIIRLEMLPEADRKAKLLGDWWTFSGQVFGEFRLEPFYNEPANACHVVSPRIPDPRLPRVLALDWGFKAMTYGMWGVPLPNKSALIYREFSTLNQETNVVDPQAVRVWTTKVANICMLEGIDPYVVLDPSAWQDRGQGKIADQFYATWKEVCGKGPKLDKAENDRISGKLLAHEYLRWMPRPKFIRTIAEEYDVELASWIFRNRGLEAHKAYLAQFLPQSETIEENLPRIHITSDCKILIKTIPLCIYDEKKGDEDVKEFAGDDPYDDFRYFLKKVDTLNIPTSLTDLINHEGVAKEFENENDINKYYRRMEILESQKSKGPKPISMGYRRGRGRR